MGIYHKSVEEINNEQKEIERAQGNPRAFSVLYERYYKEIYLFVFKRTGNESATEDVVSQVFIKCLSNLGKYTFKGVPFSAWLYRIASNEVNLYYRQTKKQRFDSLDESGVERLSSEECIPGLDPFILSKILDKLKDQEVHLLELRYFESNSVKEVANIMDISESNVKVKVFRLLAKIRKIVEKEGIA